MKVVPIAFLLFQFTLGITLPPDDNPHVEPRQYSGCGTYLLGISYSLLENNFPSPIFNVANPDSILEN